MAQGKNGIGLKNYEKACVTAFKSRQYRITQSRLAVVRCLGTAENPLSVKEILEKVPEKIDQVSVYRILETMESLGLVHRVFPSGHYVSCEHTQCQHADHILLQCQTCQKLTEIEVPGEMASPLKWYLEQRYSFKLDWHRTTVNGLCQNCAEKTNLENH